MKNSHEFVHEYLKKPEYIELMRRLGALGDGNQDQSKFMPYAPFSCMQLISCFCSLLALSYLICLGLLLSPCFTHL